MKCLVIDDEPLAIKILEKYISQLPDLELIEKFNDPLEAVDFLNNHPIDMVFLDINMPTLNGLELIESLENPPHVIITTAYREYAVEGFELNVTDYLVKPISFPRFLKAVNKVKGNAKGNVDSEDITNSSGQPSESKRNNEFIFIKTDKKLQKVRLTDIKYVKSLKDYILILTEGKNFITHINLNAFTNSLPENFVRIHRSYTVPLDKIESVQGNSVEINKELLPIGRNFQKEIKEKILNSGLDLWSK